MNMNGTVSLYQTPNDSTSTLRPRNNLNRLISYEDGGLQSDVMTRTSSTASTPPHLDLRSASPSPTSSRARSKGQSQNAQPQIDDTHKRNVSDGYDRRASSGLWEPWTSIQGIASSFLSGEQTGNPVRRVSSMSKPRTGRMHHDKTYGLKQAQAEWGPKAEDAPKASSIAEQRALLQAKRRELLLLQSNRAATGQDSFGRHKRKDSDASVSTVKISLPDEGDVFVYKHKVEPQDTMAGVVIKYGCQPESFRKANRFWPNDNIQRKDFVVLPVDACSTRGKKTEAPYMANLFKTNTDCSPFALESAADSLSVGSSPEMGSRGTEPFPEADVNFSDTTSGSSYKHESWVLLPSLSQPVEILRISKRALGYFPPPRRKSQSASSTPFSHSGTSTPKTSFDMLRHPPTHAAQQAQLSQHLSSRLSPSQSPSRPASVPTHLNSSSRTRSSSTVSESKTTSQNAFLSALSGPGGVGTLRGLRSERAKPGPADDPLNKKAAQYVPDYLPQDHPDYRSSAGDGLRPPHSRTISSSLRATPRASIDSIRSSRSNSSTVPAAIAGWMGKVASSPMRKKNELNKGERGNLNLTLGVLGEGRVVGMDDLIELADTPDEISRQLHDAVEERTPTGFIPSKTIGGIGGARQDDEDVMNERFPVRGRVRRAYEAD